MTLALNYLVAALLGLAAVHSLTYRIALRSLRRRHQDLWERLGKPRYVFGFPVMTSAFLDFYNKRRFRELPPSRARSLFGWAHRSYHAAVGLFFVILVLLLVGTVGG